MRIEGGLEFIAVGEWVGYCCCCLRWNGNSIKLFVGRWDVDGWGILIDKEDGSLCLFCK